MYVCTYTHHQPYLPLLSTGKYSQQPDKKKAKPFPIHTFSHYNHYEYPVIISVFAVRVVTADDHGE